MELREIPEPVGQGCGCPATGPVSMMRACQLRASSIGHDGSPHADDALALGRVAVGTHGRRDRPRRASCPGSRWRCRRCRSRVRRRYEEQERHALAELQQVADRDGRGGRGRPRRVAGPGPAAARRGARARHRRCRLVAPRRGRPGAGRQRRAAPPERPGSPAGGCARRLRGGRGAAWARSASASTDRPSRARRCRAAGRLAQLRRTRGPR